MKKPIAVGLSALAVAVALPSAAQAADTQSCYGKLTQAKSAERDTGVAYQWVCAEAVKSFALVTNAQTASFDATADVFEAKENGGELSGTDRFGECEGDLPGFGFTCGTGAYGGFGRVTKGTFDSMDGPCKRDAARHLILRGSLIVQSAGGKLSGPFDLGKVGGCPKPAKKAKAKRTHKRAANK
jgi:hypothetical protein